MKLAVLFPGIGYHCDKPILYFARELAKQVGYDEVINLSYICKADNIRGNDKKMREVGCEFPYKSRVMPTKEPLKTLKAPYMARNPMNWGFFRLIVPLKNLKNEVGIKIYVKNKNGI